MYEIIDIKDKYEEDIGLIIVTRMKMILRDLKTNDIFYSIVTFFQKIDADDAEIGKHICPTNKIKITKEENYNVK